MDTIAVVRQKGVINPPSLTRRSARAVAMDANGRIPLMHVKNLGFHKLPGGGIDEGENSGETVVRETEEETGAVIEVEGEIGRIVEIKAEKRQISHCYYGRVLRKGEPSPTEREKEQGQSVIWVSIEEAISLVSKDSCHERAVTVRERELTILARAKEIFSS